MITQQSDSLTMVFSTNGEKEYRFWTPLMERYEFAKDPYMEFRYGINIITYDSLGGEASRLRADYAIFYEKRELWETRGNVVGVSADGRELHTQQLFWNQKIDKVYSNVDSRIVDGYDEFVGEGFESDSEFKEWIFKESEGRMWVESDDEGGSASGTNGEPESVERPQSYSPSENESYLEQQEQRRQEKLRRGGVGRP
jgi:LPS export ABC transporter protein LptC